MGTLLNSEGPDNSPGSALFAKSKNDYTILLEIINYITFIYTMDNPDLTVKLYGKFYWHERVKDEDR